MQIVIVDLGIGNLRSVEQALKTVAPDQDVLVSSKAEDIMNADRMVLPGQGAIGSWFKAYDEYGLEAAVLDALNSKPSFGICVGMQAMFAHSTEDGGIDGLGLFDGSVEHFSDHQPSDVIAKIPHMGWNQVEQNTDHVLWSDIDNHARFYFLHSFAATSADDLVIQGTADYHHKFIAAVGRDNVFATQFHPEKSHDDGLQLLKNFANWNGQV
jgi:glutamine amidotransferase